MTRILEQTWRGCWTLPHVGAHPGTIYLIVFVAGGAAAAGWVGAAFMAVILLPLYLKGAYDRAQRSNQLGKEE